MTTVPGRRKSAVDLGFSKTFSTSDTCVARRGLRTIALCVAVSVTATSAATVALSQTVDEIDFARDILSALQDNSFDANREYCGMIGVDQIGRLVASRPRKGRVDSCLPRDPQDAVEIIASFHTHGAFSFDADAEVPSTDDVIGDMEEGVDGYVATPGGRFWFIDGQTGVARQLCGLGCLPSDEDFVPELFGPVSQRYTLPALERREAE